MSIYAQNDGSVSTGVVPESGSKWVSAAAIVNVATKRLGKVSVIVAGTTAGAVNDSAPGAVAQNNQVLTVPANAPVGSVYPMDWPIGGSLTITPGTGGVLAVSYS